MVDVSDDLEVDGDWLLSGQTKLPSPRIRINEAALPVNGNYLEYHATGVSVSGFTLQYISLYSLSSTHNSSHLLTHLTSTHHSTSLIRTPHLQTLLPHASHTLPPPLAPAGGGAQLSPAVRLSAGLTHMAQFTWLLSRLLDTPLPHPMKLEKIIWSVTGKECVHMLVPTSHYSHFLSVCVCVCLCMCMCVVITGVLT